MSPESLIFDIDGTLWDSRALVAQGYNRYFRSCGLERLCVTADDLTKLFGKTLEAIADIVLAEMPAPRRYEMMKACMDEEQAFMREDPCQVAFAGVVQTLEILAKKYRLFLVSNCEKGYPELLLDKLDIGHLFQGHLCYGDTGLPKGETIRILMARHGIESAIYIGDTQGDMEACQFAQIPFVWCRYGFGRADRWDAAIDSFPELLQLLKIDSENLP